MLSPAPYSVSAVITTYDRLEEAKRAVQSVLAQTYPLAEVLVVEDGMDSGVESWLDAQGLTQVRYIRHPENRGLAATRNTGWQAAVGEYVAYLDDDDVWSPTRVERQVALLDKLSASEREKVAVVTCATEMRFEDKNRSSFRRPGNSGNLERQIQRQGPVTPSSSFLFRRDALAKVGGFDENLKSCIDHDIWMSLAVAGFDALAVDEALVVHRDRFGRSTAMGATTRRIAGVRQYVEKWTPTYQAWFGKEGGIRYGRRYFADVMSHLAATKLVSGSFAEARSAVSAALRFGSNPIALVATVLGKFVFFAAQQYFPASLIGLLKGARQRLFSRA